MRWGDHKADGLFLDAVKLVWSFGLGAAPGAERTFDTVSLANTWGFGFGSTSASSPWPFTFSVAGFYMVTHGVQFGSTGGAGVSGYSALRKKIGGTTTYLDVTRVFLPTQGFWLGGGGVQFQQFAVGDSIDAVCRTDDPYSTAVPVTTTAHIIRLRGSGTAG